MAGFLAEWAWDAWRHRRSHRDERIDTSLLNLVVGRTEAITLRQDEVATTLQSLHGELASLRQALEERSGRAVPVQGEGGAPLLDQESARADRSSSPELKEIDGLTPAMRQHLQEAGIETCEQLAQCSPEQLNEILQVPVWSAAETAGWIRRASELAGRR